MGLAKVPYFIAPPQYSYSQKPKSFEEEKEFQYVLTCAVPTRRNVTDHLSSNCRIAAILCAGCLRP